MGGPWKPPPCGTHEPAALALLGPQNLQPGDGGDRAGMGRGSPAPAQLCDAARGGLCGSVPVPGGGGAAPEQSPCTSFRFDAAIMFESPEAASCRLTLTNTAQKMRLGGCKLFSSSRGKKKTNPKNAPRQRAGGVRAVTPCHIP